MPSRRHLLQAGLSLAALPAWARAASDSALKTATGPDWAPWTAPTPPLVLPDLSGREQKLSSWRGNVVIVSFWATWCDPCRDEIPIMSTMAKRHREEGLRLIAVNVGESPAKITAFLKKWPVAARSCTTAIAPPPKNGTPPACPPTTWSTAAARSATGTWANWTGHRTA